MDGPTAICQSSRHPAEGHLTELAGIPAIVAFS